LAAADPAPHHQYLHGQRLLVPLVVHAPHRLRLLLVKAAPLLRDWSSFHVLLSAEMSGSQSCLAKRWVSWVAKM
jgi:hypothetical protein